MAAEYLKARWASIAHLKRAKFDSKPANRSLPRRGSWRDRSTARRYKTHAKATISPTGTRSRRLISSEGPDLDSERHRGVKLPFSRQ